MSLAPSGLRRPTFPQWARPFRLRRAWVRWIAVVALAVPLGSRGEKLVTVRSLVDAAYVARHADVAEAPKPETYVFAKGQYFPGVTLDFGMERTSFRMLATTLAADLKKRHYEPTKSVTDADLIIMVHWGVTIPNENGAALFLLDPDVLRQSAIAVEVARQQTQENALLNEGSSGLTGSVAAAESTMRFESNVMSSQYGANEYREYSNAELLGYRTALESSDQSMLETDVSAALHAMVNEERYFIILMAYDGPSMRTGKKKRLWTTRMSIRAAGVNFATAVDRMSSVAAGFNGKPTDGIAMELAKERHGTVQVGEIKVIGEVPEATARPPP